MFKSWHSFSAVIPLTVLRHVEILLMIILDYLTAYNVNFYSFSYTVAHFFWNQMLVHLIFKCFLLGRNYYKGPLYTYLAYIWRGMSFKL